MNPIIINCIGLLSPADVEPLLASSARPADAPYDRCFLLVTSTDFLYAMGSDDNAPIREKLLARLSVDSIGIIFYCKTQQSYILYDVRQSEIIQIKQDFDTTQAASIDLERLLDKHSNDSFVHGGAQYHFATPSHNHTNAFFRLGDSIKNRDDLDRVTFWLLKAIDRSDYIFIDSWSIAAIPLRALQILSKQTAFDALPAHPAKKMVDCKHIVCAPTPALKSAQTPLLLVSVVSSGSLVDKFRELFNEVYPSKVLTTVSVFAFSENDYSLCCVDRSVVNYNFDNCDLCDKGSKAIEIHPSAYYVKDPTDSGVSLTKKIAETGYSFFQKYHSHLDDIVTFHKGDTSMGNKHYAYFLDYTKISSLECFRSSLNTMLAERITPRSVVLTMVNDPAILAAAETFGASSFLVSAPEDMLAEATFSAIANSDKVVIYDSVTISGNSFTKFNNFLRQDPELSEAIKDITFLAGIFRPTSTKKQRELLNSLAYPEARVARAFDSIEHLILPDVGPAECPWCLEFGAIKSSIKPSLKSTGSFHKRVSKLANLTDGIRGIDAIFHVDRSSETIVLGAESYLAPTQTAICGVILAAASALQCMRTNADEALRLAPGFPYAQVLASTNFSNYSEGLIRSALIRNASAIEFGVIEKEKTLQILLPVLGNQDQATLLSEYIIAVICGKLPSSSSLNDDVNVKLQSLMNESPEVMKLAIC